MGRREKTGSVGRRMVAPGEMLTFKREKIVQQSGRFLWTGPGQGCFPGCPCGYTPQVVILLPQRVAKAG